MIVWPGLRRSVSAISRLFNSAAFDAPLTHSAIPTRAASGTTGTFTRATTATVRDNEGVLRTAIAGEARFEGARRVRNLVPTKSEDATADAYVSNTNSSATTSVVTLTTANASFYFKASTVLVPVGAAIAGKLLLSAGSKTSVSVVIQSGSSATGAGQVNATLTSTPQWVTVSGVQGHSTASTIIIGIDNRAARGASDTSAGTVNVHAWQIEDVTAQTTQTAGEYVSVGVESAPYYHGSMVDGVKCFATDINGAAIPSSTLLGYQAEGARTNLWSYSQDFDNAAWSKTAITVAANDAVAPDGTTTADKLTNNDATSLLDRTATVTANTTYTDSIYLKYGNNAWARILYGTGADAVQLWVNIQTGVIGAVTASGGTAVISSYSIAPAANGFWHIQAAVNLGGAITVFQRRSYLVNANSSGTIVAAAYAHHWGAQVELGSFASSYIATTTIAVARNADVLTYSSAGNIDGTKGWCYGEVVWPNNINGMRLLATDSAVAYATPLEYLSGSGKLALYDGTADRLLGSFTPIASVQKIGTTWGGVAATSGVNGTVSSPAVFDGDIGVGTTIYIGAMNSAGVAQPFGAIRNVRIGQRQLSASEMQAVTA